MFPTHRSSDVFHVAMVAQQQLPCQGTTFFFGVSLEGCIAEVDLQELQKA